MQQFMQLLLTSGVSALKFILTARKVCNYKRTVCIANQVFDAIYIITGYILHMPHPCDFFVCFFASTLYAMHFHRQQRHHAAPQLRAKHFAHAFSVALIHSIDEFKRLCHPSNSAWQVKLAEACVQSHPVECNCHEPGGRA